MNFKAITKINILNALIVVLVLSFVTFHISAEPVKLIFDTDMGCDCDDAGALAVAHALADKGEAKLLGVMSERGDIDALKTIDAINTYYGRPDIPVAMPIAPVWKDCDNFTHEVGKKFPNDIEKGLMGQYLTDEIPTPVNLYRKLLANQKDNSVTIVATGFQRNLANLLNSSPSMGYSSLDGEKLVKKKVHKLVLMAGVFPDDTAEGFQTHNNFREFNMSGGKWEYGGAAQRVAKYWPTPIVYVGSDIGWPIRTGHRLFKETTKSNPVRGAYKYYPWTGNPQKGDRMSWDLTAMLYAVRGLSNYWQLEKQGQVEINNNGSNEWVSSPDDPRHNYIKFGDVSVKNIESLLGNLITKAPKNK